MAELADALDLGSSAARRPGSTPGSRIGVFGASVEYLVICTQPILDDVIINGVLQPGSMRLLLMDATALVLIGQRRAVVAT